jgi:hypothetical protein
LVPTPGTVLPGNHEVAQRDYGASTNYTKRAFSRDPPELAVAAQVRLEFSEHAEHVEEALARRRAGVDRLLGRLQ